MTKTHDKPQPDYFAEARAWEDDVSARTARSERTAWRVAAGSSLIAVLSVCALAAVAPLKTVEPFVIRVDNNTGVTDVISTLTETDGEIKEGAQDALDKYWIGEYIRRREGYVWDAREYDRETVGLLSGYAVQQEYAAFTDPDKNPNAPVSLYGENAVVRARVNSISFVGEEKGEGGERRKTAMARYVKTITRPGSLPVASHWTATVVFSYSDAAMDASARARNPLGFQTIAYRNDQENVGGR